MNWLSKQTWICVISSPLESSNSLAWPPWLPCHSVEVPSV